MNDKLIFDVDITPEELTNLYTNLESDVEFRFLVEGEFVGKVKISAPRTTEFVKSQNVRGD